MITNATPRKTPATRPGCEKKLPPLVLASFGGAEEAVGSGIKVTVLTSAGEVTTLTLEEEVMVEEVRVVWAEVELELVVWLVDERATVCIAVQMSKLP